MLHLGLQLASCALVLMRDMFGYSSAGGDSSIGLRSLMRHLGELATHHWSLSPFPGHFARGVSQPHAWGAPGKTDGVNRVHPAPAAFGTRHGLDDGDVFAGTDETGVETAAAPWPSSGAQGGRRLALDAERVRQLDSWAIGPASNAAAVAPDNQGTPGDVPRDSQGTPTGLHAAYALTKQRLHIAGG